MSSSFLQKKKQIQKKKKSIHIHTQTVSTISNSFSVAFTFFLFSLIALSLVQCSAKKQMKLRPITSVCVCVSGRSKRTSLPHRCRHRFAELMQLSNKQTKTNKQTNKKGEEYYQITVPKREHYLKKKKNITIIISWCLWCCSQCGHIHTHTHTKKKGGWEALAATGSVSWQEHMRPTVKIRFVRTQTHTHTFNKNTSTHVHTHALPLFLFTLISNRKSAIALHHAPFVIACRSLLLLLFSSFNQYNASDSSFCLLFLGLRRQRFLALLHCIVQSIIPPILLKAADHQS